MTDDEAITALVTGLLPRGWFDDVKVSVDREEVLIVGRLRPVADEPDSRCIKRFREETREQRIAIARAVTAKVDRKVSWGAQCGPTRVLFTTVSVPAMTRLRMPERRVLDTLIDAGVARSRSEALAWCVRLVGANEREWLTSLREAFEAVERARDKGPAGNPPAED